jgi:hypothetical protein
MDLVSTNTDQDLKQRQATAHMAYASKQLAANIIRIVRGAGRPFQLGDQCADFLNAAQAYRAAHGVWPTEEMHDWLSVSSTAEERERVDDAYAERVWATDDIIAGSLQIAASRMLGQRAQEAAGKREMAHGIDAREKAREAMRSALRQETKKREAADRRRSPKKKPAT